MPKTQQHAPNTWCFILHWDWQWAYEENTWRSDISNLWPKILAQNRITICRSCKNDSGRASPWWWQTSFSKIWKWWCTPQPCNLKPAQTTFQRSSTAQNIARSRKHRPDLKVLTYYGTLKLRGSPKPHTGVLNLCSGHFGWRLAIGKPLFWVKQKEPPLR